MILSFFSSRGWESWDVEYPPLVPEGMPVLVDDDLCFEDGPAALRPAAVVNRWLRELPGSGAPAPSSWKNYARALKEWTEFLAEHGVGLFDSREQLKAGLSRYCRHGPAPSRRDPAQRKCDIKTLAIEAAVDRTAFFGTRPYAHLRVEFERRLQALQQAGEIPDPREAQITRLRAENAKLRERLTQSEQTIDALTDFRTQSLVRLAAQHEEIVHLRGITAAKDRITRLPAGRTPAATMGPCG
ncbi:MULTISPECIES: hypothetical protein [Streptomyces]|uniref:hypothetical protein n=1 Tax=Streptomyces TaxID=1883 RepID=UPI001F0CD896|nr:MULTISPECIES: hypothetical protein [Streptomyces]